MQHARLSGAIKNDEWISDNDVADPNPLPSLPGYHVLVRPVAIRTETKGGIILPDQFKDDVKYLTTVGRVLAVGETAYKDPNKFPNGQWCKAKDFVAYGRHIAEMDVEAYRNKSNVEKKEEPQQDFEIEEPDEVPITHETVEAEVEEEVVEEPQQEIEELDGIKTKGAEKRIRQLVSQRKEREEVIAQQNAELAQLRSELLNSQSSNQTMEVDSLGSKEAALQERIKLAENAYLSAYDEGEKEKLLEAQNILQDAKTDLKFVSARKKQLEQIQTQVETNKTVDHQEAQGYTPQPQQAQQQYDPRAVEWANNNDWFGKDEVTTAVALAIDQQLKTEGYDPSSSDFYDEVDSRLRKELPNKFRAADNTQKPPQQVAGSSRKSSPSNKRKVKLSTKDVSLAKKWGIPLDTYAAEKAKVDKVGDGYTAIGNT